LEHRYSILIALTADEMWVYCWGVETRKTAVAAKGILSMMQIFCPVIC